MSYTKFSKEVTKWLKANGLPCYGTANDSPEETKTRLDAWMRGSKEILRQWITEKRYRKLISCAHGGWYQDDVIFEPLAEHFVANHLFDELRFLCERGIRFSAEDMLSTIQSEKEEHGALDIDVYKRQASQPMSRWLRFWSDSAKQHSTSLCISVCSMRMMAA